MRFCWLVALLCACGSTPVAPTTTKPDDDPVRPLPVVMITIEEPTPAPVEASFALTFAADPADDPIGLEGLTQILVALAASEGQARAAAYQATLSPIHDGRVAGWKIVGPRAAFVQLATIVIDIALDPRLPGTELATRTERWREQLRVRPDASIEAARRWAAALASGHGRAIGVEPTDATLATVNREDLVRLHRELARTATWQLDASEPLPPELDARVRDFFGPRTKQPRPCPAPRDRAYRMPGRAGSELVVVRAARAPDADREAWARSLAALDDYPSMHVSGDVDVRALGDRVVVTSVGPVDWPRVIGQLEAVGPVPTSLVAPDWITVTLGGADGLELRREGTICRR